MELSLSGNSLKTLTRSITCLARVGNELAIQASPSQLAFHTLNSSRSAYQSIIFKPEFFDVYTVSTALVQYSVLVKAVCAVLRTPVTSIDHLCVLLPDSDASKVQWTLECLSGMKKSYWITCNIEPDIQHLSLDRTKFPSSFVVRPRDFSRLLANFQSSLQEITVIATEPTSLPSDVASEIGGKAVELRSYIDPTKDDSDAALHTQLWIDPTEEFLQYVHSGDPVDVTFAVKELKAFLSFCEGCEVDIHLFFEKAGEPILMAPKFGLDDGSNSDFDVTLVLSTMLVSQLREQTPLDHQPAVEPRTSGQANQRTHERARGAASEHPSDHTRIWSELSGSAARSGSGAEGRQVEEQPSPHAASGQCGMERATTMDMSKMRSSRGNMHDGHGHSPPMETTHMDREEPQERDEMDGHERTQHHPSNGAGANHMEEPQERDEMDGHGRTQHHPSNGAGANHMEEPQERDEMDGHGRTQHHPSNGAGANHMEEPQVMNEMDGHGWTQHHPSNWVDADEDDDEDEDELCVQATPPY